MNKRQIKDAMLARGYSPDVVEKAIKKCERWQRAAYGSVDWAEDDQTENVEAYCKDTLKNPNGLNTTNRNVIK